MFASYSFSEANYGQNTLAGGLPAGIEYQQHAARVGLERRFGKNVTAKLQYGYDSYAEPGSGSVNNFIAHSVFGTITCRWP